MSDVVITFIQEFFKNVFRDGIVQFPSEKVALLVKQIHAVEERLEEVTEIPRVMPLLVFNVFTK